MSNFKLRKVIVPTEKGWESVVKTEFNVSINRRKKTEEFVIKFSDEYNSPTGKLNLKKLKIISDTFGTDNIDVEEVKDPGCETCDYGSEYGYNIIVRSPTKNIDKEVVTIEGLR